MDDTSRQQEEQGALRDVVTHAASHPSDPDRIETLQMIARAQGYRPSAAMRLLLNFASGIRLGTLHIILPDGTERLFEGSKPGPDGVFVIHRDRVARRFLTGGILGFCESYLDGDWSSPDMDRLFEVALINEQALNEMLRGKTWYRLVNYLRHLTRPNTRSGSRRNIAYHYDLGNSFYREWLDPTMTYSSALFAHEAEALDAAQRRKYAALADQMDLQPGMHVLEIGCGWGGFAEYAAAERGARVTAITISREQHDYAVRRIAEAGLQDRVEIRMQDYRDVEGQFDRIASIEMFEAVGEKYWPIFFETVHARLIEGGRAALQIITIEDHRFDHYRKGGDYIQKYIFPGGMLPSLTELKRQIASAGLTFHGEHGFGASYARTLREWNTAFQKAWPTLAGQGYDERFKRMWEQYLTYCAAGFSVGTIDVVQVALGRD